MANEEIISVSQAKVPTVVSYDPADGKLKIGESAKADGIQNTTNMFNFKMDLFATEKEFTENPKYWYGVTYANEKNKYEMKTFTAKEVTKFFLKELLRNVELPNKLIIGEPAVREANLKENFRKNIRDVFSDLGYANIDLFFEPFAVFQYYRLFEKAFPVETRSQIILVIDIGGGTFNSCIIATTNDGKLSRGGANMLPLGLQGEQCGGSMIDLELAKIVIEKSKTKGFSWKDNPNDRAKSPVLFRIEEAKIYLSDKIGQKSQINENFEKYRTKVVLPKGTLHPEREIQEELTGNDLKKVVQYMWRYHYGKIITKTVAEAEEKLKKPIGKIDKVIIAGGSSKLPFIKQEIMTVLPTLVKELDIYIGNDIGDAVACGIACECRELVRSKNNRDLTVGTIAPCLLNDLYVAFKTERRGRIIFPKINGKESEGLLFSSPFEIDKTCMKFELEIDGELTDRLFYFFNDQPIADEDPSCLNATDYVLSIPAGGRVSKRLTLELQINENGTVKPVFHFRGKGSEAKKLATPITCQEFYLEEKSIIEGDGFLGIDFGTSNSYLVKLVSTSHEKEEVYSYPKFDIKSSVVEILRQKQIEIEQLTSQNVLTQNIVQRQARKNKYLMIFHSNKIEGNSLTRGETESIIVGDKPAKLSKSQIEAINLDEAFAWVLENLVLITSEPENFIKHINKIILREIKSAAGEYRKGPVRISDMDYVPPPGFLVPEFMRQLGDEIKQGLNDRSAIEFAASIHTKLVMIHPFEDGNGRTARLVMNAILLTHSLPLIVINYADKHRYFDGIVGANRGDISGFLEFIIECYSNELEEVKASIFINEQTELDCQSSFDEVESLKKGGEFGPKLKAFLDAKVGALMKKKEDDYQIWAEAFDGFKADIQAMVIAFNNMQEYKQLGLFLNFIEYDKLNFEKYLDLSKGKPVPRTWFFRIDISDGKSYEKILFFFQHSSYEFRNNGEMALVSLCLARFDGSRYRRLKYEPVQLHEIGYSNGKIKFLLNDDQVIIGDVRPIISDYVLYEVFQNYM